ncbi:hypothetical protein PSEUDO9AG_50267 [Pseudomonas sp. 9Ag]|nr:hypothetical protein PSEUDO9AG_50267 [Pseudomonas sp. 9Ag]
MRLAVVVLEAIVIWFLWSVEPDIIQIWLNFVRFFA